MTSNYIYLTVICFVSFLLYILLSMKKVCFFIIMSWSATGYAQQDINSILDYTLSFRGLTREDITIPLDLYMPGEKSPTNDSKLLLPVVKNLMLSPLSSFEFLDSLSKMKEMTLKELVLKMFSMINYSGKPVYENYYFTTNINDLLDMIEDRMQQSRDNEQELLKVFSKEETSFLGKNVLSVIEDTDKDDPSNMDIFRFNRARDSSIAVSKRTVDLLNKLKRESIYKFSMEDFDFYYQLYNYVGENRKYLNKYFEQGLHGSYPNQFGATIDFYGRKIIIGGTENNVYKGDYALIIDLGGDDVYDLENKGRFGDNFTCIIDLSGNDVYTTHSSFSLGASAFSSSFVFDKEGDDVYRCNDVGLGSSIGGLGLVYDENGNDTYHGISFSVGAASFGAGLVADRNGNDFYIANSYSEGFGMTEGIGAIVDNKGSDSYLVDSRSLDIGRYEDHYVSMCQGFGLGVRPDYAGGIGLIIEGEGNDVYNTDIFGQGGAYWYSLGAIVDYSGNDKYNGYQYSQGSGIHLAVGLLKDYDGWDFYQSDGVSQGCGHDFGFGLLYDVRGNDNYSAYSLSQGAGNANGIGILIDEGGRDGYLNKQPEISRGYGNPRREYGSIGIFLDASGTDFYSNPGMDSTAENSSQWGVMMDYYLQEIPQQIMVNEFKIPIDTMSGSSGPRSRDPLHYTVSDYFMMAKTIEPRFSLWQEYGFKQLIEESPGASQYILTRLATSDHRETLLMRNLTRKIPRAVEDVLIQKLNKYITDKSSMSPSEVSFASFLLGETGNDTGKDVLLQLTYDDNIRVRSSAVNALGKMKIESNDFIQKAAKRLTELASEKTDKKLYGKDVAFAFKNFKNESNIPMLLDMLTNNYFGVRFLASENLKDFGDTYYNYITDEVLRKLSSGEIWFNAFLYSLLNVSDEKFQSVLNKVLTLDVSRNEVINDVLIDILKKKGSQYSGTVKELESRSRLKIK
jgi:hypothetical protein